MLRLAAALALGLAATPAWADPAEDAARAANKAADAIILTGPVGALFILAVIGLSLVCVVLGLVVRALWNTIKERDAATASMRERHADALTALQEKRAAELVDNVKQVASTAISGSAAITASNERLADTAGRISILAERLLPVPEAIGRIEGRLNEVARSCARGAA